MNSKLVKMLIYGQYGIIVLLWFGFSLLIGHQVTNGIVTGRGDVLGFRNHRDALYLCMVLDLPLVLMCAVLVSRVEKNFNSASKLIGSWLMVGVVTIFGYAIAGLIVDLLRMAGF